MNNSTNIFAVKLKYLKTFNRDTESTYTFKAFDALGNLVTFMSENAPQDYSGIILRDARLFSLIHYKDGKVIGRGFYKRRPFVAEGELLSMTTEL